MLIPCLIKAVVTLKSGGSKMCSVATTVESWKQTIAAKVLKFILRLLDEGWN
jgi:hypothetical protein